MNKVLSRNYFRNFCGDDFVLVYTSDVAEEEIYQNQLEKENRNYD